MHSAFIKHMFDCKSSNGQFNKKVTDCDECWDGSEMDAVLEEAKAGLEYGGLTCYGCYNK